MYFGHFVFVQRKKHLRKFHITTNVLRIPQPKIRYVFEPFVSYYKTGLDFRSRFHAHLNQLHYYLNSNSSAPPQ